MGYAVAAAVVEGDHRGSLWPDTGLAPLRWGEEGERRGSLCQATGLAPLRRDDRGEWERAFELWLAGKAPNTQRAYRRAWEDLLAFTGKHPGEMLSADLQEWAEDLAARALHPVVLRGLQETGRRASEDGCGLSPSTIALWLSAASSFFGYVTTRYLVATGDGGERPLHGHNPALTVERPDVGEYARADYLDAAALGRLLRAIPRHSVAGLRDYTLFLGYILTGRRNAEWRALRWGDLRARGVQVFYTWSGKNTEQARHELPPPVWEAMRDYLEAAGRLEGMRGEDYVFTPLSDRAARLPNVDGASWDANRPLSGEAVNRLLKKYARRAGLDAGRVHVHVLRHSAAMLEEELGTSLAEISKFLGHADPKTTMRYLGHLRGRPDGTWRAKAELLGIGGGGG
jgi:integrase